MARVDGACRAQPVYSLLLEDPYTHRAYTKPRGYAGDAVMMDYPYFREASDNTSKRGRAIFKSTTGLHNSLSVVFRRELLARYIDGIALRCRSPRILAVARGHLREAGVSQAMMNSQVGEFVALDQDTESLEIIHYHCANQRKALYLRGVWRFSPAICVLELFDGTGDSVATHTPASAVV